MWLLSDRLGPCRFVGFPPLISHELVVCSGAGFDAFSCTREALEAFNSSTSLRKTRTVAANHEATSSFIEKRSTEEDTKKGTETRDYTQEGLQMQLTAVASARRMLELAVKIAVHKHQGPRRELSLHKDSGRPTDWATTRAHGARAGL